jgi:ABC-type lipoprotein release transport system permease subunit
VNGSTINTLGLIGVMAWRNLWRNTRRTLMTAGTISLGLALLLVSLGLGSGGDRQLIERLVRMGGAHVAVEAPGYNVTRSLDRTIPLDRVPALVSALTSASDGHGFRAVAAPRLYVSGLASSADGSSGVNIIGIDPAVEGPVSDIRGGITAGTYFDGAAGNTASNTASAITTTTTTTTTTTNTAVVGFGVARKLALTPRAKFVLMAQGPGSGDIQSLLVRVDGIVRTNVEEIDQSAVFVRLGTAQALTGLQGRAHQIAIVLDDMDQTDRAASLLRAGAGADLEVLTWSELMPNQRDLVRLNVAARVLVNVAFFIIIEFLVLNTLEMAVLERRREYALLDAVGLTPSRRFLLSLTEGIWIAAFSIAAGAALGYAGHLYFQRHGLSLHYFASGGAATPGTITGQVLYSALPATQAVMATTLVFLVTVVLAIIPARMAASHPDLQLLR